MILFRRHGKIRRHARGMYWARKCSSNNSLIIHFNTLHPWNFLFYIKWTLLFKLSNKIVYYFHERTSNVKENLRIKIPAIQKSLYCWLRFAGLGAAKTYESGAVFSPQSPHQGRRRSVHHFCQGADCQKSRKCSLFVHYNEQNNTWISLC